MASPVFSLMRNNIDELYTQSLIRHRIEDHLARLKADATTRQLEDTDRDRYEYDFYNLLHVLGYDAATYYAILRINGYTHPHEFRVDTVQLLIPNSDGLRWLHDIHEMYRRYGQ